MYTIYEVQNKIKFKGDLNMEIYVNQKDLQNAIDKAEKGDRQTQKNTDIRIYIVRSIK